MQEVLDEMTQFAQRQQAEYVEHRATVLGMTTEDCWKWMAGIYCASLSKDDRRALIRLYEDLE
jgi:hypothetical protein